MKTQQGMQKYYLVRKYPADDKKTRLSTRKYNREQDYPAEDKETQLNAIQANVVRETHLCLACEYPAKDK